MSNRKIKRNNPLNIRYSELNKWQGLIGNENGFCKFETLGYGFRAAFVLLRNYYRGGHRSIRQIITRWAPPIENPTENYIEFVSNKMQDLGYDSYGVDFENSPLDLMNDMILIDLICVMACFETGIRFYHDEVWQLLRPLVAFTHDDVLPSRSGSILR